MAIIFVCVASLFLALGNLLMRKSLDAGGTTKMYLVLQLSVCFFISILLGPVKTSSYSINGPVVCFGLFTGFVLIALLISLGKALEKGPPGLTFSILSSAAVFPGIVMAAIFGESGGFPYTPWHAVGSVLVLIGLFWAGRERSDGDSIQSVMPSKRTWVILVSSMFVIHILLLLLYQGRALLMSRIMPGMVTSLSVLPISSEQIASEWFVPMMYVGAVVIQLAIFLKTDARWPQKKEWLYGFAGGIANGLCTFFLLYGTKVAMGLENAIIFPVYSIGTIVFSNLWSQRLYGECVNWRACQVCALGILLGSVDWKIALAALGW
jgi:drug/metabolite transporter (DMT)-like permease